MYVILHALPYVMLPYFNVTYATSHVIDFIISYFIVFIYMLNNNEVR